MPPEAHEDLNVGQSQVCFRKDPLMNRDSVCVVIVQVGIRASAVRMLAWPGLAKAAAFFSVRWYVKGGGIECCCAPF